MSNDNQSTRSERHNNNDNQQRNVGGLIKKILLWVAGIVVLLMVASAALFFYYASSAPKISRSDLTSQSITTIYDDQNRVISRLGAQKREYAKDNQIPKQLKNAVVSIEDRRFYKHHGVDTIRILGATSNVFGRSAGMQGGSTLTQQLVKLSVFSTAASDRTLKRKAQEAWLAINVEQHFSKSQILDFYINKVYMGNGIYGMQTAAQYYYGKDLNDLDLSQLALLAGMPQSPTYYNPLVSNTKYATQRRNEVLNAMVRSNYITQSQANQAASESVTAGLDPDHGNISGSGTAVDSKVVDPYVKQVLADLQAQGYDPYSDGLKVHTNLDLDAQQHLYDAANKNVQFQNDKMQAGVAVTDPHNGQIIAMLGGRHTGNVVYGLNRAVQSNRSSGSTAKPLMDYGPAIEYLQWPTFKSIADTRFVFPGTNTVLHDFDKKYKGNMTMREALVQSRNVPAIRALQAVGIKRATSFLDGLGISQKQPYTLQNGIALYISPLQVSAAYAAFANGGTYYKPYYISSITTQDGSVKQFNPKGKRAMNKATAYMITDMLKGVFTDSQGSATDARLDGVNQAGKTGTTNYPGNSSQSGVMDSWMAGYTKNYSIAVWTGYDHPLEPGGSISEQYVKSAQLLYKDLMQYLDSQNHASDWTMPDTVEAVRVKGKRQLVIRDSKWAFDYTEDTSDDRDSSSTSSSSDSSSSSSSSSSASSSSSESRTEERNNTPAESSSSSAPASSSSSAPAQSSSSSPASATQPSTTNP